MKITQVKITTKDKPISLPDKGETADLEDFRLAIRDKYNRMKQHWTNKYWNEDIPIESRFKTLLADWKKQNLKE